MTLVILEQQTIVRKNRHRLLCRPLARRRRLQERHQRVRHLPHPDHGVEHVAAAARLLTAGARDEGELELVEGVRVGGEVCGGGGRVDAGDEGAEVGDPGQGGAGSPGEGLLAVFEVVWGRVGRGGRGGVVGGGVADGEPAAFAVCEERGEGGAGAGGTENAGEGLGAADEEGPVGKGRGRVVVADGEGAVVEGAAGAGQGCGGGGVSVGISGVEMGDERTEVEGEHAKEEQVGGVVEVADAVGAVEEARGRPGGSFVKEDSLGEVVVAAVWPVVGEVEGADGQHGSHDVVTFQAELDYSDTPEIADSGVGCEGRIGVGGEVVKKFQLQEWELIVLAIGLSWGEKWRLRRWSLGS